MRDDRKGIPNELKAMTDRHEKSTLSVDRQDKEMMLVSYINKKKSGKKNINALTTMHEKVKVTNDERYRPHVLLMYGHAKEGVDVVDSISTYHSSRIKSKQ